MIKLEADNKYVYIRGAGRTTLRKLEKATSYLVAGFFFSPAFKNKRWDGREHLLKYKSGSGPESGYRVPLGLLEDLTAALEDLGKRFTLDFSRRRPARSKVAYKWNESIELRPYQLKAVEKITKKGWQRGRGLLKMPIRSGKTKTAARIIFELGVKTLFIVPSQMLLHQTRAALEEALQVPVGAIGDSEWTECDVTVATIQSLTRARGGERKQKDGSTKRLKADARFIALLKNYDCVVWDEAHHLRGNEWHAVMMAFDAPYKLGLSATVYLDSSRETERGVIWLKACCGGIRVNISTSELIESGFLMRPSIELHRIRKPDLMRSRWSKTLTNLAIYENKHRNERVIALALEYLEQGLSVLIVTNRLNQVALLADALDSAGVRYRTVTGKDRAEARADAVAAYTSGRAKVLLGTVFGEGVDIPSIECVINAEGGRDVKATVQRMRNLTISKGKTRAVFIDFMDLTNGYFAEHSRDRLAAYRSEEAFLVSIKS